MKYFTKEWYMAMQKSSLDVRFHADERAAKLDEALYEEIFERKVQEERNHFEGMYSIIKDVEVEEVEPEKWMLDLYRITGSEAHKSDKPAYEYVLYQHPEALREVVRLQIDDEILYNRTFYPQEILDMVADERVFACRVATEEVIRRMKEISQKNRQFVDETFQKACARRNTLEGRGSGDILNYFGFHDVAVIGMRWESSDLIIELDEAFNFNEIQSMRLHDCEIEYMDEGVVGAEWIYDELYLNTDGRISAGILLYTSDGGMDRESHLRQVDLTARDITFVRAEGAEDREIREQKIKEELIRMGIDLTKPIVIQHYWEAERRVDECEKQLQEVPAAECSEDD